MGELRQAGSELILGFASVLDYFIDIDGLPKENVLKFILDDGSWFAVRPLGTESKIKIYDSVKSTNRTEVVRRFGYVLKTIKGFVNR